MSQIFHPAMNTVAKATIFGALFIIVGAMFVGYTIERSPYVTDAGVAREQPVPFSHEHHVAGLGLDCRYCHTAVESSAIAGVPATKVCMTCHSQIWTNAAMLEPVRESWRSGKPIAWARVHDLADYAYFNHSIHVAKGIGCNTCHGPVDKMPLMYQDKSLQMQWCLECHRNPEQFIRPRDKVFDMSFTPQGDRKDLVTKYHVNVSQLTNCYVCHR
jgi:Cytochrome c7 and related cytochrome c